MAPALGELVVHALVLPFPDEGAGDAVGGPDDVPVVGHAAGAPLGEYSVRMTGTLAAVGAGGHGLESRSSVGIMVVLEVGPGVLVQVLLGDEGQARGVVGLHVVELGLVIDAVAAFVAAAPGDDAGAVLVAGQGLLGAEDVGPGAGGVVDLVGYPAGGYLVQDVEAGLVAQFHEPLRVVVVAGANGVDVVGLHEDDVCLPALLGQGVAVGREFLVAADAGEFDGHAIDHRTRPS